MHFNLFVIERTFNIGLLIQNFILSFYYMFKGMMTIFRDSQIFFTWFLIIRILVKQMRVLQKKIEKTEIKEDALIRLRILRHKLDEASHFTHKFEAVSVQLLRIELWELKDEEISMLANEVQDLVKQIDSCSQLVLLLRKCLDLIGLRNLDARINFLYLISQQDKYISKMEKHECLLQAIRVIDYKTAHINEKYENSPSRKIKQKFDEFCCLEYCKVVEKEQQFYRILDKGIKIIKENIRKDNLYFNKDFFMTFDDLENMSTQTKSVNPFNNTIHQRRPLRIMNNNKTEENPKSKAKEKAQSIVKDHRKKNYISQKQFNKYLKLIEFYSIGKKKSNLPERKQFYEKQLNKAIHLAKTVKSQAVVQESIKMITDSQQYYIPLEKDNQQQRISEKRRKQCIDEEKHKMTKSTVFTQNMMKSSSKSGSFHIKNPQKKGKTLHLGEADPILQKRQERISSNFIKRRNLVEKDLQNKAQHKYIKMKALDKLINENSLSQIKNCQQSSFKSEEQNQSNDRQKQSQHLSRPGIMEKQSHSESQASSKKSQNSEGLSTEQKIIISEQIQKIIEKITQKLNARSSQQMSDMESERVQSLIEESLQQIENETCKNEQMCRSMKSSKLKISRFKVQNNEVEFSSALSSYQQKLLNSSQNLGSLLATEKAIEEKLLTSSIVTVSHITEESCSEEISLAEQMVKIFLESICEEVLNKAMMQKPSIISIQECSLPEVQNEKPQIDVSQLCLLTKKIVASWIAHLEKQVCRQICQKVVQERTKQRQLQKQLPLVFKEIKEDLNLGFQNQIDQNKKVRFLQDQKFEERSLQLQKQQKKHEEKEVSSHSAQKIDAAEKNQGELSQALQYTYPKQTHPKIKQSGQVTLNLKSENDMKQTNAEKDKTFNITVIDPSKTERVKENFNIQHCFQSTKTIEERGQLRSLEPNQLDEQELGHAALSEMSKETRKILLDFSKRKTGDELLFSINLPQKLEELVVTNSLKLRKPSQQNFQIQSQNSVNFYLSESKNTLGQRNFYEMSIVGKLCTAQYLQQCDMKFPYHCLQNLQTINEKISNVHNYHFMKTCSSNDLQSEKGGSIPHNKYSDKIKDGWRLMVQGLWTKVQSTVIDLKNSDFQIKVTCQLYEKLNDNKMIDVLIRLLSMRKRESQKNQNFSAEQYSLLSKNRIREKNSFHHFPSIHFKNISPQDLQKLQKNLQITIGIKVFFSEKGHLKVNESLEAAQILALL